MAMSEEIARLVGTLHFKVDLSGLQTFEAKLAGVESKLRHFSSLANKKFNVGVRLDDATLKSSMDRAAASKIRFSNVTIDKGSVDKAATTVTERLSRTPIVLSNIKIDTSKLLAQRSAMRNTVGKTVVGLDVGVHVERAERELKAWKKSAEARHKINLPVKIDLTSVIAERAKIRSTLESVNVGIGLVLRMNNAEAKIRAWKRATEERFKLYINADISRAKLYRNATASLKAVGQRLGTFTVNSPKIKLTVDRQALRAEIASVLEQIKREVKIKIDLTGHVQGTPRLGSGYGGLGSHAGAGVAGGLVGQGMGFMRGLIPGLGAAFAVSKLNDISQQIQGQDLALTAVTGSKQDGQAAKERLRVMADDIGFNARELSPSYTKMIASGKASGMGMEDTEKIFKAMAEYGRVMGLDSESMKGSMRAVEQMMNKGQIMSEELKGQLGERFPAAVALFAKSQKMTMPELMKAMEKGQIKSDSLKAFAVTLAEEARKGGALDEAKNSRAAQQARMGNTFTDSIESFDKGGFDTGLTEFFKQMANSLSGMQPMIKSLGMAFEILIAPVNAFVTLMGDLGRIWPTLAQGLGLTTGQLSALAAVAAVFLSPLGGVVMGISLLVLAVEDFVGFLQGKDSLFGRLFKNLDDEKLLAIFTLGQAFIDAKNAVVEMSKALGEFFGIMDKEANIEMFKKGLGAYFDLIVEKATDAINLVKNLANVITNLAKGDFSAAAGELKDYASTLMHFTGARYLLRPEYREATDERWSAQRAATQGRLVERLQGETDDRERGQKMKDAVQPNNPTDVSITPANVTLTGPISLIFPNSETKETDIEHAIKRAISKAIQMTNADLSEAK